MNRAENLRFAQEIWDKKIIPTLIEYIKIPNKSPQFDKEWQAHGYMDQAVTLISQWCKNEGFAEMTLEVLRLEDRTPLIFMDIPGTQPDDTILLYGHLDKQPEMTGWEPDLAPWKPVLKGDKLYGRGGADDGYAAFASLAAIKSVRSQGLAHARCVIIIEACEESGSADLPFYIDALQERIGKPSLVICLDSGCGNYEQLWMTTSLRGLVGGTLSISTLTQGIHSGMGSGIAPSCMRILRQLLNRIEQESTGDVILPALQTNIPVDRIQQAQEAATVLGDAIANDLPFQAGVQAEASSNAELILRRTWKPALSVTGCNGMPALENAGNVTLPSLAVKLSMRLPPTVEPDKAASALKQTLEANAPYKACVQFTIDDQGPGWNAPSLAPWLQKAANDASLAYFEKPAMYMGEGGSIPFMGMLGAKFPEAQFVITGLLGPGSNAHGPNEFLHIPMGKKLTACIADIIVSHALR